MVHLIVDCLSVGFIAVMLGEAYFILLNKRVLGWLKIWGYAKVENMALREVLFQCDVCFCGQLGLWGAIIYSVINGIGLKFFITVPLSISIALIGSTLLGRLIHGESAIGIRNGFKKMNINDLPLLND